MPLRSDSGDNKNQISTKRKKRTRKGPNLKTASVGQQAERRDLLKRVAHSKQPYLTKDTTKTSPATSNKSSMKSVHEDLCMSTLASDVPVMPCLNDYVSVKACAVMCALAFNNSNDRPALHILSMLDKIFLHHSAISKLTSNKMRTQEINSTPVPSSVIDAIGVGEALSKNVRQCRAHFNSTKSTDYHLNEALTLLERVCDGRHYKLVTLTQLSVIMFGLAKTIKIDHDHLRGLVDKLQQQELLDTCNKSLDQQANKIRARQPTDADGRIALLNIVSELAPGLIAVDKGTLKARSALAARQNHDDKAQLLESTDHPFVRLIETYTRQLINDDFYHKDTPDDQEQDAQEPLNDEAKAHMRRVIFEVKRKQTDEKRQPTEEEKQIEKDITAALAEDRKLTQREMEFALKVVGAGTALSKRAIDQMLEVLVKDELMYRNEKNQLYERIQLISPTRSIIAYSDCVQQISEFVVIVMVGGPTP